MTVVVNLLGGSGCGKSTCAAHLFSEMKMQGHLIEQVTEYVKRWAWQGRKPNGFDQVYIFGKQAQSESMLYNKVDYIVTDSPLLLSGYYEQYHLKREITLPAILNFLNYAKEHDVHHINFFLTRHKEFDPRGRFETEEQARAIDQDMKQWLTSLDIPFINVDVQDKERSDFIISYLKEQGHVKA